MGARTWANAIHFDDGSWRWSSSRNYSCCVWVIRSGFRWNVHSLTVSACYVLHLDAGGTHRNGCHQVSTFRGANRIKRATVRFSDAPNLAHRPAPHYVANHALRTLPERGDDTQVSREGRLLPHTFGRYTALPKYVGCCWYGGIRGCGMLVDPVLAQHQLAKAYAVEPHGWYFCSLAIYDKLSSKVVFALKDFLVGIPYTLVAFTRELVIIEIAAPGHLAATFGIITTVHYLGKPFATRLNVLLSTNHVDVEQDTNEEGLEIATEMWIIFTIRIVVLLAIVRLLPRQKRHALERKLRSEPNLVIPLVMFICVVLVFGTVVTSSVLAIIPSTSCLAFAGGDGCV